MAIQAQSSFYQKPIFLLGISERSGTNYFADLIRLHPACESPAPVWEDYLLYHSDLLASFASSVPRRWNSSWGVRGIGLEESLYRHIGDGLIEFLCSRTNGKRLLTKTPNVRNLPQFFKLFPQAYLLILVRDGRAVVESHIKSFGRDYETVMRNWAKAADVILRFRENADSAGFKYRIVKYEDLCQNLEKELPCVLKFLDLPVNEYDMNAALQLPVRGSSELRGGKSSVHWKPVEKTKDFNPILRWQNWSRAKHERFNWIADRYMNQLGYFKKEYNGFRWAWVVWNLALDIAWHVKRILRSILPQLRKRFESVKRNFD